MLQFIFSTLSLLVSVIFMQMKHPLAMGMMLLIQTTLICVITGLFSKTFWFSYVLFLVFLGGMLVLFIYVTSLASNEMFSISMKMLTLSGMFMSFVMIIMLISDPLIYSPFLMNNESNEIINFSSYSMENSLILNKLYNYPTNLLTLILINYLFLTLVAVVKITNFFYGPLRPQS